MSRSPAVLCIDDNVLGLAVRKAMLETRDYTAFTAESGRAGLEIVARERIDLVILDYEMPDMNGEQVARRLRTHCPTLPILLLTGYPGRIPKSLLSAVDGFVVKGSPPQVLLQEVERITSALAEVLEQPSRRSRTRKKHASDLPGRSSRSLRECRRKRKR